MFNLGDFSMKKTLVAIAALAAVSSFAQSSVTLYGVADVWLGSLKSNSVTVTGAGTAASPFVLTQSSITQRKIDSGGQSGSRWGLRGTEDLGGGLKANFVFESGLNVDTGTAAQGGLAFGRQVFVGLSGGFGEVRFGRQYSAYDVAKSGITSAQQNNSFDVTGGVNGFTAADFRALNVNPIAAGTTTAAELKTAADKVAGNLGAWTGYAARIDNSLSYTTPNFGGITGQVVLGFGENKTAATSATLNSSFHLAYANGPIAAVLAYQNDVIAKTALGDSAVQNTMLGGSYDFGVAKVFAAYNRANIKFAGSSDKATEYSLGARAPFGPVTLVGQYAQSKIKDLNDKSRGFSVEALYSLSKRTDTYVGATSTKLGNDTKNNLFAVGVRHRF
jgi:predicted porin